MTVDEDHEVDDVASERLLFHFSLETDPPVPIPAGPQGTRMVIPVTGGTVTGPELSGRVVPPSGDWTTMRADGSTQLDIRLTVLTDDGAAVLVTGSGVATIGPDGITVQAAHRYETGDERYQWLNRTITTGRGHMDGGAVEVDVFTRC